MGSWYLIQFKRNSYKLAERNLNNQGFKTFLPVQDITSRGKSKFLTAIRPLFPGYMFVKIELDTEPWHKINSTPGVSRLICQEGLPKRVPQDIVSGLMARCDDLGKLLAPTPLERGDPVAVLTGALTKFVATVETIDSDKRIWLLMDIMGQHARVRVYPEQIRPL